MASLSITQAWNEAAEFVRREAGLLFPIAFLLLALPSALLEAVTPRPAGPGQVEGLGLWFLVLLIAFVAAIVSNVAISYLALRSGTSVAEALRRGASRFLALFATACLIGLAFIILAIVASILIFMLVPNALAAVQSGATTTPAVTTAVLLLVLIFVPVAFYFGARLLMMTPVAAAETAGPFEIISRSWRLTAPFAWKLVGFFVLVSILIGVLRAAIAAVAGIFFALVAGPPEPGSTSAWLVIIVMAIVNTVIVAYFASLVARIYAQLAGDAGTQRVFA